MDAGTGRIWLFNSEAELKEWEKETGRKAVPLSKQEAEKLKPLPLGQRKGVMRNKPCLCGSGRKFKKCCWDKYL